MKEVAKVYGDVRTGTTYTSKLIRSNFDVIAVTHELGFKHVPRKDGKWDVWQKLKPKKYEAHRDILAAAHEDRVRVIVTAKHPYAWIHSYYRIMRLWGKPVKNREKAVASLQAYSRKYKEWLADDYDFVKIDYTQTISDPHSFLAMLAEKWNWPRLEKGQTIFKLWQDSSANPRKKFTRADYYKEQKYLTIDSWYKELVDENTDWEFFKKNFGYKRTRD